MNFFETISKLCEVPATSGFETYASKRAAYLLERLCDQVTIDAMGNVYALRRCGLPAAKTLLLDAHIDEIGFLVTGYQEGFLRFEPLGGVDPRVLPAREVWILTEPRRLGVITCLPPHIQSREEMDAAFERSALYVDVGLSDDQARQSIPIGTPMVFAADCVKLQNDFISGRALDDRASLVALMRALELMKNKKLAIDVVLLASVQEELGCRGATVGGYTVNPDWAVAVDVTHATTPDSGKATTFDAGSGTAVGVGPNLNRTVSDALLRIAREKKIPHAVEVCGGETGTNAWPLQITAQGIPTGLLSIPLRYMHTPCETLCESDIEATARLVAEYALTLSGEVSRNA